MKKLTERNMDPDDQHDIAASDAIIELAEVNALRAENAALKQQLAQAQAEFRTPNANLPPLGDPPRRKMVIEIEVSADFERRLDNQWMVEREIHADRWAWNWRDAWLSPDEAKPLVENREALNACLRQNGEIAKLKDEAKRLEAELAVAVELLRILQPQVKNWLAGSGEYEQINAFLARHRKGQ